MKIEYKGFWLDSWHILIGDCIHGFNRESLGRLQKIVERAINDPDSKLQPEPEREEEKKEG